MDIQKTCCVTGHRDVAPAKLLEVSRRLLEEITAAYADGYTHFIMGGAAGTDLLFARLVCEFREQGHRLTLEADIPYRNRLKSPDPELRMILPKCDIVTVISETYVPSCFFARNRDMVQKSCRVLAVFDGRERGGTYFTVRYARAMARELRIIEI